MKRYTIKIYENMKSNKIIKIIETNSLRKYQKYLDLDTCSCYDKKLKQFI